MNSDLRRVLISLAVVVVVGGGIAGIVYGIPWPEYKEASYRARIPYKTVTKDDSSAPKGNVSVQQSGEDGEKVVTYEEKFVDGKFKSRTKKSERIVKRPTDEIRLIGTCEKTLTFTTEDGWQITISSVYRGMASLEGIGEIKGDKLVLEGTVTNPGNAGYRSSNLFGGMIFRPASRPQALARLPDRLELGHMVGTMTVLSFLKSWAMKQSQCGFWRCLTLITSTKTRTSRILATLKFLSLAITESSSSPRPSLLKVCLF